MRYNARIINNVNHKTIKLENVESEKANILQETLKSAGGEASVAGETSDLSVKSIDVMLHGTIVQFRQAISMLKLQHDLAAVIREIEAVLNSSEQFPYREYELGRYRLTIKPSRTLIMGILNITPDSFSDGGKHNTMDEALRHVDQIIRDGADIIDIGAESTRPYGASKITAQDEIDRLLPVLDKVLKISSVPVSVDTYKASVAREALKLGAHIVNDIWGLQNDPDMAAVVAEYGAPVIIMHNQNGTDYQRDVMSHICKFLRNSIEIGTAAGIQPDKFIVDPGPGFGKVQADNLMVMARLEELKSLGCPILLATSRKKFIGETLGLMVDERVEGTGATVALGISKGANIIRVHDVKPMARIAKMTDAMLSVK